LTTATEEVLEEEVAEAPAPTTVTIEEKKEEVASAPDANDVCAEVVSAEEVAEAEASPTKQLTRVSSAWEMEGGGAQLAVKEGDFISVWKSSETEHGWIYAEDPANAERAAWLPTCVLEELPSNQRWIKAVQAMQAAHETQLSVVEGSVYKVSIDSRTTEGWIYAEAIRVTMESAGESAEEAGWVPVFCFDGAAELEQ